MVFQKRINYFTLALDKHSKMTTQLTRKTRSAWHNSTYTKGGVSCSTENFVVNKTSVLRIYICDKNPYHRLARNRYNQFYETIDFFNTLTFMDN